MVICCYLKSKLSWVFCMLPTLAVVDYISTFPQPADLSGYTSRLFSLGENPGNVPFQYISPLLHRLKPLVSRPFIFTQGLWDEKGQGQRTFVASVPLLGNDYIFLFFKSLGIHSLAFHLCKKRHRVQDQQNVASEIHLDSNLARDG